MAQLRITAGRVWKAFYWTLAGAAFWFVYDGVQHPEKFDDKTLPPSAVESRLPGGAFRANLPEVSLNYTGAVADIENPVIDPATGLRRIWGPWGIGARGRETWTSYDQVYAFGLRERMHDDLLKGKSVGLLSGKVIEPGDIPAKSGMGNSINERLLDELRRQSFEECKVIQQHWIFAERWGISEGGNMTELRRLAAECQYWLSEYLRKGLDKP